MQEFAYRDYLSSAFMQRTRTAPMLDETEEYMLATRWQEQHDERALDRLVASHLRLVAKLARGYRGYGLPMEDLVSEGIVGLMQALARFRPERGARLSAYAMWWIKAAIHDYIFASASLVRIVSTSPQRRLFFKLKGLKARHHIAEKGDMAPDDVERIAAALAVPPAEVIAMNRRLGVHDVSLNMPLGDEEDGQALQDRLADERADQEDELAKRETGALRNRLLVNALPCLNRREREIFTARRLSDHPPTLESLSAIYGVTPERVRQIEMRAFGKIEQAIRSAVAQQERDRQALPRREPALVSPA